MRSFAVAVLTALVALGAGPASSVAQPAHPAAATAPSPDDLPPGEGSDTVASVCTTCHESKVITAKRRTRQEWEEIIERMRSEGLSVDDSQRAAILAYLASRLGPSSAP